MLNLPAGTVIFWLQHTTCLIRNCAAGELGRRGMAERNAVLKLNCLAPLIALISQPKECRHSRKVWSALQPGAFPTAQWHGTIITAFSLRHTTLTLHGLWMVANYQAWRKTPFQPRHFTDSVKLHHVYTDWLKSHIWVGGTGMLSPRLLNTSLHLNLTFHPMCYEF